MRLFALLAVAARLCFAQAAPEATYEKLFRFLHAESEEALTESAITIRSVAEIRDFVIDKSSRTLMVKGTPRQVALAEWVFAELDKPKGDSSVGAEFRFAANEDDVSRVFYLAHATTPQMVIQLTTVVRSALEIRRAFVANLSRRIVMRGTAEQMAGAEWLIRKLDGPTLDTTKKDSAEPFRLSDDPVEGPRSVRVLYLADDSSDIATLETATFLRGMAEIRRMFVYTPARAIVLCASPSQHAFADWMLAQFQAGETSASVHRVADNPADVARVFALQNASPEMLRETVASLRNTAGIRHVFALNHNGMVGVRGTTLQLGAAERILTTR